MMHPPRQIWAMEPKSRFHLFSALAAAMRAKPWAYEQILEQ